MNLGLQAAAICGLALIASAIGAPQASAWYPGLCVENATSQAVDVVVGEHDGHPEEISDGLSWGSLAPHQRRCGIVDLNSDQVEILHFKAAGADAKGHARAWRRCPAGPGEGPLYTIRRSFFGGLSCRASLATGGIGGGEDDEGDEG